MSAGEVEAGERSELTSFDRRIYKFYKIDRTTLSAGVSPRRLMQQSSLQQSSNLQLLLVHRQSSKTMASDSNPALGP